MVDSLLLIYLHYVFFQHWLDNLKTLSSQLKGKLALFRPIEFSIKLHTIKSEWSIAYMYIEGSQVYFVKIIRETDLSKSDTYFCSPFKCNVLYLHFHCESLNEPLHLRCGSYLHEHIDLSHTHIRTI